MSLCIAVIIEGQHKNDQCNDQCSVHKVLIWHFLQLQLAVVDYRWLIEPSRRQLLKVKVLRLGGFPLTSTAACAAAIVIISSIRFEGHFDNFLPQSLAFAWQGKANLKLFFSDCLVQEFYSATKQSNYFQLQSKVYTLALVLLTFPANAWLGCPLRTETAKMRLVEYSQLKQRWKSYQSKTNVLSRQKWLTVKMNCKIMGVKDRDGLRFEGFGELEVLGMDEDHGRHFGPQLTHTLAIWHNDDTMTIT